MALTRAEAQQLDARDPLASFRDRFVITDEHKLYLDGNSLGRLPKGTRERLHRAIDQWGDELVGGWSEWIEAPTRTGDALAEVLGAARARCSSPTAPRSTSTSSSTRCWTPTRRCARSSPTPTTSPPTATCSRASRAPAASAWRSSTRATR